jgi:hypothetical protein
MKILAEGTYTLYFMAMTVDTPWRTKAWAKELEGLSPLAR